MGSQSNLIFCKSIISLPFIFCNTILVLWTLVSFYRLYLVRRAGNSGPLLLPAFFQFSTIPANKREKKQKQKLNHRRQSQSELNGNPDRRKSILHPTVPAKLSKFLPWIGIFLGCLVGLFMTIFSDSFVLLRDCRGNCLGSQVEFAEWKSPLVMLVSTCVFHIPSSLCYLLIYCIVKRHLRQQVSLGHKYSFRASDFAFFSCFCCLFAYQRLDFPKVRCKKYCMHKTSMGQQFKRPSSSHFSSSCQRFTTLTFKTVLTIFFAPKKYCSNISHSAGVALLQNF